MDFSILINPLKAFIKYWHFEYILARIPSSLDLGELTIVLVFASMLNDTFISTMLFLKVLKPVQLWVIEIRIWHYNVTKKCKLASAIHNHML